MPQSNFFHRRKTSLKKSLKVFYQLKDYLISKRSKLSETTYEEVKSLLLDLKAAIDKGDLHKAYELRLQATKEVQLKVKKSVWDYVYENVIEIGVLLLTVALINQVWFQMYEIPSGSMRPTLLEKDRLIATKTNFGINFPFKKGHLRFNPQLAKRGNLAILQNDKLPKSENKSRYLFIFPAQKQFVKRLIGKPGDTLYFYGGKIYGVDRHGNEIKEFHQSEAFEPLEHVPFNSFEGEVISNTTPPSGGQKIHSSVYLYQMDQLVGKLYVGNSGSMQGKFYNGSQWVDESPNLAYQDLWGIRNYAMTRLVTGEEAQSLGGPSSLKKESYFLEFLHSPHLNFPRPHLGIDLEGRIRPRLTLEKSYLKLDPTSLHQLKSSLSTSRFVIKNERAGNYSLERGFKPNPYSPSFKGVPNGTYEFLKGVAYSIDRFGTQRELSQDHPLNSNDPKNIQKLFNLGMQMLTLFEPSAKHQDFIPRRYAYFRDGDLYVMGNPLFKANDAALQKFNSEERSKTYPFKDHGAPLLSNGQLDKDLIMNYGLEVPKKHYLFLGDNHAGSKDCRSWGFIPEKGIQGSPAVILWPFSSRTGLLNQNRASWFNGSSQFVTFLGLSLIGFSIFIKRRRRKKLL